MKNKLDVVLLHSPRCWTGHCTLEEDSYRWQDAWRNLEALYEQGYVSNIGVSNFNPSELMELLQLAKQPVTVVQNWMDPFHQDKEVMYDMLIRMNSFLQLCFLLNVLLLNSSSV